MGAGQRSPNDSGSFLEAVWDGCSPHPGLRRWVDFQKGASLTAAASQDWTCPLRGVRASTIPGQGTRGAQRQGREMHWGHFQDGEGRRRRLPGRCVCYSVGAGLASGWKSPACYCTCPPTGAILQDVRQPYRFPRALTTSMPFRSAEKMKSVHAALFFQGLTS